MFNLTAMKKLFYILVSLIWLSACSTSLPPFLEPVSGEKITPPLPKAPEKVRPAVILKNLHGGWVLNRQPVAKWGMSLPTVLGAVPDTAISVEYMEEMLTLPIGLRLPLKRAKVLYRIITHLTIETVELQFVNVDHVYSSSNHEASHFLLEGLTRKTELKPTGFPQLTADDILKHKILMEYGTPKEFDGVYHHYTDSKTSMKVRVVDDMHLMIRLSSREVERKLRQAINEMYSEEGIEFQKKQLLQGLDF